MARQKKISWSENWRFLISELIIEYCYCNNTPNQAELKLLLRQRYPAYRHGWAYECWLKQVAIAMEFIELVKAGDQPADNFRTFSLNKMKQNIRLAHPKNQTSPGQMTLL